MNQLNQFSKLPGSLVQARLGVSPEETRQCRITAGFEPVYAGVINLHTIVTKLKKNQHKIVLKCEKCCGISAVISVLLYQKSIW